MIKLLGLDMDGTALTTDLKVKDSTIKAIKDALDNNVIVVPTTGRNLDIIPKEIVEIPGIEYVITSNGAVVTNIKDNEVLYKQPISKENLEKIVDVLENYDLIREMIIDGVDYIKESDYSHYREFTPEQFWDIYDNDMVSIPDEEFEKKLKNEDVEKLSFRVRLGKEEIIDDVFNELELIPDIMYLAQAEGTNEITNIEANKGEALAALCNILGIDNTQVMSIGDSSNDISMLTFAGTSVAMGQAKDKVKELADYITASNDEDGVSLAIDRFIINGDKKEDDIPEELIKKVIKANRG